MRTSYRFSAAFVLRLLGLGLIAVGVGTVLLVLVGVVAHLDVVAVAGLGALALLIVLGVGLVVVRRARVVRLDETGYRIGYVRGAGVRAAEWRSVEDVVTAEIDEQRCVILRLRDGRSSTVPVEVLATRPDAFVEVLRTHLNTGHGYRPLPRRR